MAELIKSVKALGEAITGEKLENVDFEEVRGTKGIKEAEYKVGDLNIKVAAASGLKNPAVIVDTNHANSGKKYLEQIRIAKEVLHSANHNELIYKMVKGLMIESYIEDGTQKVEECIYGKSITDPCLGWEKTEKLILEIAELRKMNK